MSVKEKRVGTKAQIRAARERGKRIGVAIFLAIILLVVAFSVYFVYPYLAQSPDQDNNPPVQPKAAIVDQARLSPAGGFDEAFVENVTNVLEQAGYTVDYISGEKTDVEFYRNLPKQGYSIIILRTHSAIREDAEPHSLAIFTSENYSQSSHFSELWNEQLVGVAYTDEDRDKGICYFGVTPKFVKDCMKGTFSSTVIIMLGCKGLNNTEMAEAFIQKGAKVYMGWEKAIFFSHTDTATVRLLQNLLIEKQTIDQAVANTNQEVGADPAENSTLTYYPLGVGQERIKKP
jgi:hypothetical protein